MISWLSYRLGFYTYNSFILHIDIGHVCRSLICKFYALEKILRTMKMCPASIDAAIS